MENGESHIRQSVSRGFIGMSHLPSGLTHRLTERENILVLILTSIVTLYLPVYFPELLIQFQDGFPYFPLHW